MLGLPYEILTAIAGVIGLVAFGWWKGRKSSEEKETKRKLKSIEVRQEKQKDAETQDDKALVDRLSDKSRRVRTGR